MCVCFDLPGFFAGLPLSLAAGCFGGGVAPLLAGAGAAGFALGDAGAAGFD